LLSMGPTSYPVFGTRFDCGKVTDFPSLYYSFSFGLCILYSCIYRMC
jgi:hypothetical protein